MTIKEAIADRAYGSVEILQTLIAKGIYPIIPLFSNRSGSYVEPNHFLFYSFYVLKS